MISNDRVPHESTLNDHNRRAQLILRFSISAHTTIHEEMSNHTVSPQPCYAHDLARRQSKRYQPCTAEPHMLSPAAPRLVTLTHHTDKRGYPIVLFAVVFVALDLRILSTLCGRNAHSPVGRPKSGVVSRRHGFPQAGSGSREHTTPCAWFCLEQHIRHFCQFVFTKHIRQRSSNDPR